MHVTLEEKIDFTRHLHIIIKSGITAVGSLRIIRKQATSKSLKKILDSIILDVENGKFLADALENYKDIFGEFYISVIRIGEKSGTLIENLKYLYEEMKKSRMLRSKVKVAMIYPAILFLATIAVAVFLTFYIFPKIISAFSSFGSNLPLPTKILIESLGFLKSYGLILLIVFLGLLVIFRLSLKIKSIRYAVNFLMLKTPVLGVLIRNFNIANTARILGILLKSGMNIVESLMIAANALDNIVYKVSLQKASEEVRRGKPLSQFLATQPLLFPPILSEMIYVGETTGNLEETLLYLFDYYTEEIESALKNFTASIEPIIILFMGLIVGFVALAVILPIYSLTQIVH